MTVAVNRGMRDITITSFKRCSIAVVWAFFLLLACGVGVLANEPATPAGRGPTKGGLQESPPIEPWMFLGVELVGSVLSAEGDSLIIDLPGRFLPKTGAEGEVFHPAEDGKLRSVAVFTCKEVYGDRIKGVLRPWGKKVLSGDVVLIGASVPPGVVMSIRARAPKIGKRKLNPITAPPGMSSRSAQETQLKLIQTQSEADYRQFTQTCLNLQRCTPNQRIALLSSAARANHVEAAWSLAMIYHNGMLGGYGNGGPVRRDPEKASTWLRRAAELGHAGAQAQMASIFEGKLESYEGKWKGVPIDPEKAAAWRRKASATQEEDRRLHDAWKKSRVEGKVVRVAEDKVIIELINSNQPEKGDMVELFYAGADLEMKAGFYVVSEVNGKVITAVVLTGGICKPQPGFTAVFRKAESGKSNP